MKKYTTSENGELLKFVNNWNERAIIMSIAKTADAKYIECAKDLLNKAGSIENIEKYLTQTHKTRDLYAICKIFNVTFSKYNKTAIINFIATLVECLLKTPEQIAQEEEKINNAVKERKLSRKELADMLNHCSLIAIYNSAEKNYIAIHPMIKLHATKSAFINIVFFEEYRSLKEISELNYQQTAYEVMKLLLTDYTKEELEYCINSAYDSKFDTQDIAPLAEADKAFR